MNFSLRQGVIYILIRVKIMKLFGKIMTIGCALTAGWLAAGCDSLWDAEMDVSPDYYGVGISVPTYGYYPGPPAIDPSLWNPGVSGWGWGVNVPPPSVPVAPPQWGVRPGVRPNVPTGYLRPGYNSSSTPSVTPPVASDTPSAPAVPSQGSGYQRPASTGRH